MNLVEYTKRGNERGGVLLRALQAYGEEHSVPVIASIELTGKCSLACDMCYMRVQRNNPELRERTTQEWIDIGKQARDLGTIHVSFTGGEPFTRPDFQEIYEAYVDMGFLVSILSNLTEVDEKTVRWLEKKRPLSIGMSLYGNSEEAYQALCHRKGAYAKVMRALDLLSDAKIDLLVKMLRLPTNEHEIPDMVQMAKGRGWRYTVSDYLIDARAETGRKNTYIQSCSTSGCGYDDCFDDFLQGQFENGTEKELFESVKRQSAAMVSQIKRPGFMCTAGRSRYWITWFGKMQACCELSSPAADPFETSLSEAWEFIKNETEKKTHPQECLKCPYLAICGVCPARHYGESGEYNMVSRRVCLDTRDRFNSMVERKKQK